MEFGKEALKFENGAFSYFGVPAIMPAGTGKPKHIQTHHLSWREAIDRYRLKMHRYSIDIIFTSTVTLTIACSTQSTTYSYMSFFWYMSWFSLSYSRPQVSIPQQWTGPIRVHVVRRELLPVEWRWYCGLPARLLRPATHTPADHQGSLTLIVLPLWAKREVGSSSSRCPSLP